MPHAETSTEDLKIEEDTPKCQSTGESHSGSGRETKKRRKTRVVIEARKLMSDLAFTVRHRINQKAFTRKRLLTFEVVVLLVLQKTLKSVQLHLREFFATLGNVCAQLRAPTGSAWTQARAKLRHTAFIELNQVAVLDELDADPEELTRWHGHRLLAIDGSILRLPENKELFEHFGGHDVSNQKGACGMRVPLARLSMLYDVLNRIGISARVGKNTDSELAQALTHLAAVRPGDVLLLDRGYPGFLLFAELIAKGIHFVARCQRSSFAEVARLFERNEDGASITVSLSAKKDRRSEALRSGLPTEIKVRLVSVRLSTGELEVLATSLLDETTYPTSEFLEVYHLRWGIETYFGLLKGRLDLQNFSGLTVEAVLQDLHAAVFLCNLESIVTQDAAAQLPAQGKEPGERRHTQKLNRAISFHTLKSRVIDLLIGKRPVDEVLTELTELFLANPISVRRRTPPRNPPTSLRSLHFQKNRRKIVF